MKYFTFIIFSSLLVLDLINASSHHICQTEADCHGNFITCRDNHCVCDQDEEHSVEEMIASGEIDLSQVAPPSGSCRGVARVGEYCDNVTQICISHSTCNPFSGVCECMEDFELYIDECRRSYGFPCTSLNDKELCNPENFYHCAGPLVNGRQTCVCVDDMEYDPLHGRCVPPIGGDCDLEVAMVHMKCGHNAECRESENEFFGSCECLPDYYPEEVSPTPHKCVHVMGKSCNSSGECVTSSNDYECNPSFKLCDCKEGLVFQEEGKDCRLKVGSKCSNIHGKNCTANANCATSLATFTYQCQCGENFLPSLDGQCQFSYGTGGCANSSTNCHEESGLSCVNDTCTCKDGHTFSHKQKHCLGVHLQSCDPEKGHCVENSKCDPFEKVCTCKDTFSVGEDGTCFYGFGTLCNATGSGQCSPELGMECGYVNNEKNLTTCGCVPGQGKIFDGVSGKCLLKVGETCNYTHHGRQCIKRGFCGTGDKCQCFNGYSATPGGDCWLDFEERCNGNDSETGMTPCNSYKGLQCLEKKCQCVEGKVYSESEEFCVEVEHDAKPAPHGEEGGERPRESPYHSSSSTNIPILSIWDNHTSTSNSNFMARRALIEGFITSFMLCVIL